MAVNRKIAAIARTNTLNKGALPGIMPINPFTLPQGVLFAYSPAVKLNSSYGGGAFSALDSNSVVRTALFDSEGVYADVSAFPTYGDGVFFQTNAINDQAGGGRHFTSSTRPILDLSAASFNGKILPGVDFRSKNQNMVTSQAFVTFGGSTVNLSVFAVAGTYGWSSAGTHARSPAVYTNANGPILGFGTTSAGEFLRGASGNSPYGPGESNFYTRAGYLAIDEGQPNNSRIGVLWGNQYGPLFSAGQDLYRCFSERTHGATEAANQRLVLGNRGDLQQSHNGTVFALLGIQSTPALTDEQCLGIAAWLKLKFAGIQSGRLPSLENVSRRYRGHGAGQSLVQFYGAGGSASTGLSSDYADVRIINPTLSGYLGGVGTTKRLNTTFNSTAVGGSSMYSLVGAQTPDGPGGTSWLAYDGSTTNKRFWWDQYNNLPGPCAITWLANSVNAGGSPLVENFVVIFDQGQANAIDWLNNGEAANRDQATWKSCLYALFAWMRARVGRSFPIVIQPMGRQSGTDAQCRAIRRIEREAELELSDIYMSAETTHLTRQDSVHWGAGPADADGFDRGGKQVAATMAVAMGASGVTWRGPEIKRAEVISLTTMDLTVEYPAGCAGTDIQAVNGTLTGLVGFEVLGKTVSSAARRDASTIRLTGVGFVAGDLVQYNPTPSALDRLKMVVDNNAGLPMPLRHVFDLVAA